MLRDVAQHSRTLPSRGVTITVAQDAGVKSFSTDRSRAQDVIEAAMGGACRAAKKGSIELAASMLNAPPHPPLLLVLVSHEGPGADESELMNAAGDALEFVGTDAVPEPYGAALLRTLQAPRSDAPPESSYVLHSSISHLELSAGTAGIGARLGLRIVPVTVAQLGGYVGIYSDGLVTRYWFLLPLTPPPTRWTPSGGATRRSALLGDIVASPSLRTMPSGASLRGTGHTVAWKVVPVSGSPKSRTPDGKMVLPAPARLARDTPGVVLKSARSLRTSLVAPAAAAAAPSQADAPVADGGAPSAVRPRKIKEKVMSMSSIGGDGATPVRPCRAMLVDDESTLRRLGARMLERAGVPTDVFADGTEIAEALTPQHELLLLDIVMRHSDGAEVRTCGGAIAISDVQISFMQVCAALRTSGVTIPIFAVTGNVDPMSIEVFKRSGFDGLVAKPYSQRDVERLLVRTRQISALPVAAGEPRQFWSSLECRDDTTAR